ncbi:hypothetical protein [Dactylosporangium sp. CA-139066]|uniref:hypothetical protein n=1 Tax=Dactylosporangium sp. CA-139066 TaxID=3239930 RepID=UPI003D8DAE7B
MAEASFDDTAGWLRLGEIPNEESAFWKACDLQQNGGAPSAWKAKVDFYIHIYADSPALPLLSPGEAKEAEPFWLGLVPFAGITLTGCSSPARRSPRPGSPAAALRNGTLACSRCRTER